MSDQQPEKKLNKNLRSVSRRNEDLGHFVYGKLPPQAPKLEEAILGAIMLDKDALPVVLDILQPTSFYTPAHQKIYKVMMDLFEKTQPIDMLTVTEGLRKSGELDEAGGAYYLAELTSRVASAANIEYHARIVAQKHIQRELIRVSTQTIKNAYEDTTDVFDLLDGAEKGLFDITQNNLSRSYESMSSLTSKVLKNLEALKDKEDGLTGVPTGFTEIDRLTSGLQKSDLIILAARPGMGKTSYVLSLARNAAADFGKGVAIFSLEMSNEQLVSRILSLEAEISGHKLRNAQLEDYEWQQLHTSIEKMSEAPIFIDDTPGINIFELRAKCRRLKMQHDIQLVIIDYLQLMSGGGDNQKGNREQEVSAISRSLKALAKELSVPVIALSQLSRAVETRGGTKRPQLSDLRESGCLTGDTVLIHADTGEPMTIKALAERTKQTPVPIIAMDENLQLSRQMMSKAFSSGIKKVYELKTRTGRAIKASANHPFRKLEGWKRLDELVVGDRIAVGRNIPIKKAKSQLSKDELILLAHLLGDGCILPKQPYHYTSVDPANIEVVNEAAKSLFKIDAKIVQQENWWHTYLKCPYHLTHGRKHPITHWYEELGIERVRSYKKQIPKGVFMCNSKNIALFLRHLWATDGNVSWKILKNRKKAAAIYYASTSEKMVQQIQHLLLRLNIKSTIRRVGQGKYRDNFHLQIQGAANQLNFLNQVGCYGMRGDIIPEMR
ncbi:MAG: replicative DNA helicase, partial [Bacteroidota bacterium]